MHAPQPWLCLSSNVNRVNEGRQPSCSPVHLQPAARMGRYERLVSYCQTTGVSAAHATHCATYCTACRPLLRAFPGWIRTPPPTLFSVSCPFRPFRSAHEPLSLVMSLVALSLSLPLPLSLPLSLSLAHTHTHTHGLSLTHTGQTATVSCLAPSLDGKLFASGSW